VVETLELLFEGQVADYDCRILGLSVLKGLFTPVSAEPVSFVNAPQLAEERGLVVREIKTSSSLDYVNLISVRGRLGDFFLATVPALRARFHGRITYGAIQFEGIDWELFDIVTIELIRSREVAGVFREGVRSLASQPKPVAITGFGAATWRGAGDVAQHSMEVLEYDEVSGLPLRLDGVYERDEAGQASYLDELLEIFESEGVDSAFVFLFALENLPHRPDGDPRLDLDLASPSIVKLLEDRNGQAYPDMPWEPKRAFATVAARFAGSIR